MKLTRNYSWALSPLLLTPGVVLAQQWGHGDYGSQMGWGSGMIFGPLMMLLFIVLVVVIVLSLVRWSGRENARPGRGGKREAVEILRERFARGEIDKEEFEERRRVLDE